MKNHEKARLFKKAIKEAEALEATLIKVQEGIATLGDPGNNSLEEVRTAIRRLKALAKLQGVEI